MNRGDRMDWITDALHSLYGYLTGASLWIWLGQTLLRSAVIIILAFVLKNIGNKVINTICTDKRSSPLRLTTNRRGQALKNSLNNAPPYLIMYIAIVMILDTFQVPIKTTHAGAGSAGLAIGSGAESLVKDIISAFFI